MFRQMAVIKMKEQKKSRFVHWHTHLRRSAAGTTVMIREGTYHETLDVKHSGTDGKPITFRNYENENVVISGESVTDAEYETPLIRIHDKHDIAISGLTIQDLSVSSEEATAIGIYVSGSSSHIAIKDNHIRGLRQQRMKEMLTESQFMGLAA